MTGLAYTLCVGAVGACVGSFCCNAALRSVRGEQAVIGRSACDGCGAGLSYAQTLPIWSFVHQAGRCRSCRGPIDPTHLVSEALGVIVALAALWIDPAPRAAQVALLGFTLIGSAVVDAKSRRLPDALTLLLALLGAALSLQRSAGTLALNLACGGATLAVLWGLRTASGRWRSEVGLGLGDVKLVGALALWLGLATWPAIALGSSLALGVILVRRPPDGRLAFGPYIAGAAWLVGLIQEAGVWSPWG